MRSTGCFKSDLEGVPVYGAKVQGTVPASLDISSELIAPWDQGNQGICVSVCMTDMLRYHIGTVKGQEYKKKISYYYKEREDKSVDGMTPREALEIAQQDGTIDSYAFIKSVDALQVAMISNGPVMICLPVYDTNREDFWIPSSVRERVIGYHAVTFVGYERGVSFKLRNSWGTEWGYGGYTDFPWKDIGKIIEVWTIFS